MYLLNKAAVQLSGGLGQELTQLHQQGSRGGQQGSLQLLCIHSEHAHVPLHAICNSGHNANCELELHDSAELSSYSPFLVCLCHSPLYAMPAQHLQRGECTECFPLEL